MPPASPTSTRSCRSAPTTSPGWWKAARSSSPAIAPPGRRSSTSRIAASSRNACGRSSATFAAMAEDHAQLLDEWIVSDLETLKLLGNPLRAQILQELVARPMSVKQIAAALGEPVTKLYRHVDLMLRAGVIRVVDQVVVSG